jgi:hypothetical protein
MIAAKSMQMHALPLPKNSCNPRLDPGIAEAALA